jgi:hypothetical protein
MHSQLQHPLVAIATLNWKRSEDTITCLASAANQSYPNIILIVVDNESSDESFTAITAACPQATVLRNQRNLGFAAGANIGIRHALSVGADYIFLVNNDTIFAPDTVALLLKHVVSDVGLLVPAIYYANMPDRPWSLGGLRHWLTLEKTGDTPAVLALAEPDGYLERDYVVGCGLLLTRRMLEHVGLFDERFFMYYEDMDLSLRVRNRGFRILLVPSAHMWHKVATSSGGSDSPGERYWMARSSVIFFHKHVKGLRWLVVGPYRIGSACKTVLRLYLVGRSAAAHAYIRGLRDGLRESLCV